MDAQSGSVRAMDMLVSRWQKRLWQYAFNLTSDSEAAWDVTQESWLGIIRGLRRLNDPSNFRAWAYRIVTNKVNDWIKKKRRVKTTSIEELPDPPRAAKKDTGVQEVLDRLDMTKQVVLSLYYLEQLSVSEISVALNIPKGTVKSRLHNARKELKELWERYAQ